MMWKALLVVAMLTSASPIVAQQPTVAVIPAASGTTLSGDKVSLPQDLHGRPGVLILGFTQASREQATAWGKRLAVDFHDAPEIHFYETPMLAGVPRLLRGMVLKKIAGTVSENGKHHFLPLYDHEAEWRSAVQYSQPADAYVLLLDGSGNIRWRTQGALSEAADAELQRRLQALRMQ